MRPETTPPGISFPGKQDPLVVEDAEGLVIAIRHDRRIEIGQGVEPEDAARRFCEAIVDWLDTRYERVFDV